MSSAIGQDHGDRVGSTDLVDLLGRRVREVLGRHGAAGDSRAPPLRGCPRVGVDANRQAELVAATHQAQRLLGREVALLDGHVLELGDALGDDGGEHLTLDQIGVPLGPVVGRPIDVAVEVAGARRGRRGR